MNTKLPENSLILLEGGSLRGLYTAGALDILMEHDLYFPAVAGVSAGALNAYNYVAHQPRGQHQSALPPRPAVLWPAGGSERRQLVRLELFAE